MDLAQLLGLIVGSLVFPGAFFVLALALLTQYLMRKLSARYQRRMGPSYVGPLGILQPFYDLAKLLSAKEIVVSRDAMPRAAELFLLIGLATASSSAILLPIGPFHVEGPYDFLVFFYMSSVMPAFMLVLASLALPGPYTSLGVSRMLSMMSIGEPALFAGLLVPTFISTLRGIPLCVGEASRSVGSLWLTPAGAAILALSLVGALVSLQAKVVAQPFDAPEAEQEIIAGFATEFSGPLLALASLLHDVELAVTSLAISLVILGGPSPYPWNSPLGALVAIAKYVAVVFAVTTLKNLMGRYRIEQALLQLFKYGLVPSMVAAGLATAYAMIA
ncbi:MAG: complex I subunit 1 family protein [Desulfurococcaceae archaeon]